MECQEWYDRTIRQIQAGQWDKLKPLVMDTIDKHFEQKLPLFTKELIDTTDDTKILPGDSEAL